MSSNLLFYLMWVPGLFWLFPVWAWQAIVVEGVDIPDWSVATHAIWSSPQILIILWLLVQ